MAHTLSHGLDRRLPFAVAAAVGLVLSGVLSMAAPADAAGNGWTIVPSANANPPTLNSLASVSCVTASDCWAVGSVGVGSFEFDDAGRALERKFVVHC